MGTFTRRIAIVLAAAGLLVAAGCAKDEQVTTASTTTPVTASSGSGDKSTTTTEADDEDPDADKDKASGAYAETCDAIGAIDELGDEDLDQALALLEQARDSGPDELADHWDTMADVFEKVATLDEDDPDDVAEMLELMDDPDFLEAAKAIDDFAEEECGLDIDLDPTEETSGGRTETTIDTERPGDDEVGSSGPDDPTTISAVQAYLADTDGTEDWWPVLDEAEWRSEVGVDPMWTITLTATSDWESLTTTDLVAACDAVAEHLDTVIDTDAAVQILDPDETVLVSRYFAGEDCSEG